MLDRPENTSPWKGEVGPSRSEVRVGITSFSGRGTKRSPPVASFASGSHAPTSPFQGEVFPSLSAYLSFGSSASLRPSPMKLREKSVTTMVMAGVIGRLRDLVRAIASAVSVVARKVADAGRGLARRSARERRVSRRRAKPPRDDDAEPGWGYAFA